MVRFNEILPNVDISSLIDLTDEERNELFIAKAAGDVMAKNKLFEGNLKLVVSVINKEFSDYKDIEDLFQAGCIGLLNAIENFDIDKGYKFSTYAYKTISGTIKNYIRDFDITNLFKMSANAKELARKVKKTRDKIFAETGEEPTIEEIAEILSKKKERIQDVLEATAVPVSLNDDNNIINSLGEFDNYDSLFASDLQKYETDDSESLKPQFDEGKNTCKVTEDFIKKLDDEQDFLNKNPIVWIYEIDNIDPNSYYNRLISSLYPDSDFTKEIGTDYENCGKTAILKRNELVRKAILNNMKDANGSIVNSIQIAPYYDELNVEDALTRNDRLFKVKNVRNIVFLVAIAFNLDYDKLEDLMIHCLGERKIDFKNPYEIMIAYCLKDERLTCEHYLELKQKYEDNPLNNNEQTADKNTLSYEDDFWIVDNDEDLLNLLYSIPNQNSQTAQNVFFEIVEGIRKELANRKIYEKIKNENQEELFDIAEILTAIELNPQLKKNLQEGMQITDSEIVDSFIGSIFQKKKGTFNYLKEKVFNKGNLKKLLSGDERITKEQLLLVLFFKYCLSEKYSKLKMDIKSEKSDKTVKDLYYNFKNYANPKLEKAGFDFIYLPNPFERFLMFCLVCDEPLEAFKKIMLCNN